MDTSTYKNIPVYTNLMEPYTQQRAEPAGETKKKQNYVREEKTAFRVFRETLIKLVFCRVRTEPHPG